MGAHSDERRYKEEAMRYGVEIYNPPSRHATQLPGLPYHPIGMDTYKEVEILGTGKKKKSDGRTKR